MAGAINSALFGNLWSQVGTLPARGEGKRIHDVAASILQGTGHTAEAQVANLRKALGKASVFDSIYSYLSLGAHDYKKLQKVLTSLEKELKVIEKAIKIVLDKVDPKLQVLFDEHIVERMVYFGHQVTYENGEVHFQFTKQNADGEVIEEKRCTLEELVKEGALIQEGKRYALSPNFQYTRLGFTNQKPAGWSKLLPSMISSEGKGGGYKAEIQVFSKGARPGVFSDQGHVSIKLRNDKGEEYSLAFFPEQRDRAYGKKTDLSRQFGEIVSPDPYLFMHQYRAKTVQTLDLHDEKSFDQLLTWLESYQAGEERHETGRVKKSSRSYHPLFQNCAVFAGELRDHIVKDLKAEEIETKKSNPLYDTLFALLVEIQKLLLTMAVHMPILRQSIKLDKPIDFEGKLNRGISEPKSRKVTLPIDFVTKKKRSKS